LTAERSEGAVAPNLLVYSASTPKLPKLVSELVSSEGGEEDEEEEEDGFEKLSKEEPEEGGGTTDLAASRRS
jgi:hypothetical protein